MDTLRRACDYTWRFALRGTTRLLAIEQSVRYKLRWGLLKYVEDLSFCHDDAAAEENYDV